MKLNLISDAGGRSFARAMSQAYQMGYDDAMKMHADGKRIYPRKSGVEIAKDIVSKAHKEHSAFLRYAYGAGMYQYRNEVE